MRHLLDDAAEIALHQNGLVTAAQLAQLGFSRASASRRSVSGGPWRWVLPGIYSVTNGELDEGQRLSAALLYARDPVLVTGTTALRLAGIDAVRRLDHDNVHLLVPHHRRRASSGFVTVERAQHWPRATSISGHPCVPIERAAIDASRRLTSRSDIPAILTELVRTGRCSREELAAELAIAQRRGSAHARQTLATMLDGPISAPEVELHKLWTASQLPSAVWNADLYTRAGEFIARPDAYLPEYGVAVEVDSVAFHFGADAWDHTMRRHTRMTAKGLVVLHVTPRRIAVEWPGIERDVWDAMKVQDGRDMTGIMVRPRAS